MEKDLQEVTTAVATLIEQRQRGLFDSSQVVNELQEKLRKIDQESSSAVKENDSLVNK